MCVKWMDGAMKEAWMYVHLWAYAMIGDCIYKNCHRYDCPLSRGFSLLLEVNISLWRNDNTVNRQTQGLQ